MRDDDLKALFDRLQSDEPPTGIRADDLVRRGHRIRRRRAVTTVGAGALATVCAIVLFWQWHQPTQLPAPVGPATQPAATTGPRTGPSCPTSTDPAASPGAVYCLRSPGP